MAFILILFLAIIVTFIFIYFKQKTLRHKIITSIIVIVLGILLFYVIVIALWNSSTNPAETRLRDREATEQNLH
jgi:protein-S-isoprenylcysteine O-methyltransferase Ste14